jgi:DNA-binding Lrp family transcriptional regulator
MVRGERHHNAKLTRADVRKIRKLIANGKLMFKEIAERFDVDPETIGAIAHSRSWVWLK